MECALLFLTHSRVNVVFWANDLRFHLAKKKKTISTLKIIKRENTASSFFFFKIIKFGEWLGG